jgi:hypothetical protein
LEDFLVNKRLSVRKGSVKDPSDDTLSAEAIPLYGDGFPTDFITEPDCQVTQIHCAVNALVRLDAQLLARSPVFVDKYWAICP